MSGTESRELLSAVRQFLRQDVLPELEGFKGYQLRVAANALGIVGRELEMGAGLTELDEQIATTLELTVGDGPITREIAVGLREGSITADETLLSYFRKRAQLSLAIDNPKYSGLRQSRERWGDLVDPGSAPEV